MDEVEELIAKLGNPDLKSREGAAQALPKIKDARVIPALIGALVDENAHMQLLAAQGLAEIGAPAFPALIEALGDERLMVRRGAGSALVAIGKPAVPALIEALKDERAEVREYVAWSLGNIGDARAVPALVEALKDENVLYHFFGALSMIGDARAVPALLGAVNHKDADMRVNAIYCLGEILRKYGTVAAVSEFEAHLQEG
jgi:HEAT repeat protein